MTTNLDDILSQFHKFCRDLSESVCALPAGTSSFEAECLVLKRVLAIGGEAMKAFFATQAGYYHWPRSTNADGQVLRYSDERRGLFYSIFGDIEFKRSYYCAMAAVCFRWTRP